jgi:hypothetical protein
MPPFRFHFQADDEILYWTESRSEEERDPANLIEESRKLKMAIVNAYQNQAVEGENEGLVSTLLDYINGEDFGNALIHPNCGVHWDKANEMAEAGRFSDLYLALQRQVKAFLPPPPAD